MYPRQSRVLAMHVSNAMVAVVAVRMYFRSSLAAVLQTSAILASEHLDNVVLIFLRLLVLTSALWYVLLYFCLLISNPIHSDSVTLPLATVTYPHPLHLAATDAQQYGLMLL